jgi:hypothetical protein
LAECPGCGSRRWTLTYQVELEVALDGDDIANAAVQERSLNTRYPLSVECAACRLRPFGAVLRDVESTADRARWPRWTA